MGSGLAAFTLFHVILSLIGIASGLVVVFGFITAKRLNAWTALFLWTTLATSVTGFLFPFHKITPGIVVGIISVVFLALAFYCRYSRQLAGAWRRVYVISAVIALYLNVFVLIAQLFDKVPALKAMAPTQSEAPFKVAQLAALLLFIVLAILGARGFRADAPRSA